MITTYGFWITVLIVTILLVTYYLLTSKKRRRPRIHESFISWREKHEKSFDKIRHSVFLIGDAGAPLLSHPDPVLSMLEAKLKKKGKKSSVIFLGDNIYPLGLPEKDDPTRKFAEKRLNAQLNVVKDHPGNVFFISGNHDWRRGRKGGLKQVIRQEEYIEKYLGRKDIFLPSGHDPGPVEVNIAPGLTVVFINTVWWLYRNWRGRRRNSSWRDDSFYKNLVKVLDKNRGNNVIMVGHHPLYSKSFHGGKFSLKQHLFPLTELGKKWYIPLPGAGSLYPLYRKYIGSIEDMAHPRYKSLREHVLEILHKSKNVVYAAGHDHNLQYIHREHHHHIVSGSGSKISHVRGGGNAVFTHAHKGFFEITYYEDGSMWIGAWETSEVGEKLAFSRIVPASEAIFSPVDGEGDDQESTSEYNRAAAGE